MDSWQVRGVKGPTYKVGPRCSNPRCRRIAEHAHHIWPRSFLKGDYPWVELPDGSIQGNLTGLCADCHDDITGRIGGHKAAIRMGIDDYRLWWCRTTGHNGSMDYEPLDPIVPQPPTREAPVASPADIESESCPTCGQSRRRRSSLPPGERRRRKSWTIAVPDDQEDGATVLDALVDDLSPIFGYSDHPNNRYFTVARALVHAQQDKQRLVTSDQGKGE